MLDIGFLYIGKTYRQDVSAFFSCTRLAAVKNEQHDEPTATTVSSGAPGILTVCSLLPGKSSGFSWASTGTL